MAWLDPLPLDEGSCRCPECFGLAEYMLQLTGRTHGLPRVRGHAPLPVEPAPGPVVLTPRRSAPQPWEPRPPRERRAA